MNTTFKGDTFEKQVHELFEKQIQSGQFILIADRLELFWKKKYFSRDRGRDIVVDIAVECYRKGAAKPYLFVLVECKDYGKAVPVDDIEEFYGKIAQITGANVKGLLFITSGLQEAAFNYAFSKGIGVVRLKNGEQEWLLERLSADPPAHIPSANQVNVFNALLQEHFVSPMPLAAMYGSKTFSDFAPLFREIIS
jgi:hypothetical protein